MVAGIEIKLKDEEIRSAIAEYIEQKVGVYVNMHDVVISPKGDGTYCCSARRDEAEPELYFRSIGQQEKVYEAGS